MKRDIHTTHTQQTLKKFLLFKRSCRATYKHRIVKSNRRRIYYIFIQTVYTPKRIICMYIKIMKTKTIHFSFQFHFYKKKKNKIFLNLKNSRVCETRDHFPFHFCYYYFAFTMFSYIFRFEFKYSTVLEKWTKKTKT